MKPVIASLRSLKIKELRKRCADLGVDASQCLEKDDLVAALVAGLGADRVVDCSALEANLEIRAADLAALIFLDVDGVLNKRASFPCGDRLGPACCARLVRLVETAQAGIVLSTTWRHNRVLKLELLEALMEAGASQDCIVGQTPDIATNRRSEEIRAWLDQHPLNIPYVVLDDIPLGDAVVSRKAVWTNPEIGLQDLDTKTAMKLLLGQTAEDKP